jgi:hypothetical protein
MTIIVEVPTPATLDRPAAVVTSGDEWPNQGRSAEQHRG